MRQRKIIGLMACDPKGVIACHHRLPWHHPVDTAFYRQLIAQQIIIMGYTTYLEMPRWVLERSYCIVFSRDPLRRRIRKVKNLMFVASIEAFLQVQSLPEDKASFIIGGGKLANDFLEHQLIDEFILTQIAALHWGDAHLAVEKISWWPNTLLGKTKDFSIHHYINPFRAEHS